MYSVPGTRQHYTWDAKPNGQYYNKAYFKFQLDLKLKNIDKPFTTPIYDGNEDVEGWQSPPRGLGVHDLVYKHRPYVHIADGEVARPTTVETMMDVSNLMRYPLDETVPELVEVYPVHLEHLRGDCTSESCFLQYADESHQKNPPTGPPAIYHITLKRNIAGEDIYFLQYWFFHGTSYTAATYTPLIGWLHDFWHEGDWEMFQTAIKLGEKSSSGNDSNDSGEFIPFACTASQHYYGQTLRWEGHGFDHTSRDQDYVRKSGVRPHIYIARKSHAIYFRPSMFDTKEPWPWGQEYEPGLQYQEPGVALTDITEEARPPVDIHGDTLISLSENPIINNWEGHWGYIYPEGDFYEDKRFGPRSPAYRGSAEVEGPIVIQEDPIRFHNDFIKPGQGDLELGGL